MLFLFFPFGGVLCTCGHGFLKRIQFDSITLCPGVPVVWWVSLPMMDSVISIRGMHCKRWRMVQANASCVVKENHLPCLHNPLSRWEEEKLDVQLWFLSDTDRRWTERDLWILRVPLWTLSSVYEMQFDGWRFFTFSLCWKLAPKQMLCWRYFNIWSARMLCRLPSWTLARKNISTTEKKWTLCLFFCNGNESEGRAHSHSRGVA